MPAALHRGRHRGRRSVVRAAALAAMLSAAATLSALAPTTDPATGAAPDTPSRRDTQPVVALGAAQQAPAAPGPVETVHGVVAPGGPAAAPQPVPTTMSMDEPIQGGLTAHQAQARSAAVLAAHEQVPSAAPSATWTPALGRTALARARSWLGMPYSWAGGSASGPTAGRCDPGQGADLDCHIIGFDCSGLMTYAWGPYAVLPHLAETQREAGRFHPTVEQLRAGDLVFFSGYLPGGIGHVAIYEGDGMVIEAPQSGEVVRRSALADLMAHDGTYRGAVRPLTSETPALGAVTGAPRRGGIVTVRGDHLAGVTSLTVGTRTVRTFVRRSDSGLVFRAPAATTGSRLSLVARTSWGAKSDPVTLSYAPVETTAAPTTRAPRPGTANPPSKPAPTTPTTPTKPTSPQPTSSAPAPPTSSVPTAPASTTPLPSGTG